MLSCSASSSSGNGLRLISLLRVSIMQESPFPKAARDMPTFPSAHNSTMGASQQHEHPQARAQQQQQDRRFGEAFDTGSTGTRPGKQRRLL